MSTFHNDGVQFFGGQVNGPVAGGYRARAVQGTDPFATEDLVRELRELVHELRVAVADGRLRVADQSATDDDLTLIEETVDATGEPGRGRLLRAAQRAAAALSASGAVPLATQLLELTGQVVG
ncbi:hypothetical protein [Virgisporangium aurantiacum]|uniref:Uncharacterized protein n=1 Tax=Virgisporangium aurantiacum TaxID=175570 RepID=A0A8J4E9T8_9ACTN|nr:hypothetical protein [Virgisporangium aurantiacum]GIJ64077.1 hypothetical protein Vau01_115930 [Virgisporangium aurantiacum]